LIKSLPNNVGIEETNAKFEKCKSYLRVAFLFLKKRAEVITKILEYRLFLNGIILRDKRIKQKTIDPLILTVSKITETKRIRVKPFPN